jgi:catechol 2,3-dioxygenase-like lactoylglutathione lyase family enzyme
LNANGHFSNIINDNIVNHMLINFILYVGDQSRSRRFYEAALGIKPRLDVTGMTEFEITPGCVLGLMPERGIKRLLPSMPEPAGGPRAEVYLTVPDPAVFHARALAAGARELCPLSSRDWGDKAAYSLDPDGHVLAFACPG